MKDLRKNRQGEPAMAQPKGANELSDDVLEAATGGSVIYTTHLSGFGDKDGTVYLLAFNDKEKQRLESKYGQLDARADGMTLDGGKQWYLESRDKETIEQYNDYLNS